MPRYFWGFYPYSETHDWPAEFYEKITRRTTQHNVLMVEVGSPDAREFVDLVQKYDMKFYIHYLVSVSQTELSQIPLYRLWVKDASETFLRYQSKLQYYHDPACEYARKQGMIICLSSKRQDYKFVVGNRARVAMDIVRIDHGFIVSRRLAEGLSAVQATGYRMIPCLRHGQAYTPDEERLDYIDDRQVEEATHFQLIITGKQISPWKMGELVPDMHGKLSCSRSNFIQCEQCRIMYSARSLRREVPSVNQFGSWDFQVVDWYESPNAGEFVTDRKDFVVSSRIMELIVTGGFTGIIPYIENYLKSYNFLLICTRSYLINA